MKTISTFLFFICIMLTTGIAQFSEDAVRYSVRGVGAGSRALGMGNAYMGVSDDFSASLWNPAGLAQMRRLELMGGISSNGITNDATFFSKTQQSSTTATSVNNIGFVFPFPTLQGSFVVAFGYHRIADYSSAMTFDGFNDKSSIISSLYDNDVHYDIPYNTYLTNPTGYTSVQKNVQQRGTIKEGGNLGAWSFAGAVDIEENISIGLSLNVYSGLYEYTRNFLEEDTRNIYSNSSANLPSDSAYLRFNKFYYDSFVNSELSGSSITIGMMYRSDFFRVGMVVKGPTSVKIEEAYSNEGQSVFDNTGGWALLPKTEYKYSVPNDTVGPNEYGVQSPWTIGVGASLYLLPELLIAIDIEQTDWTQIQWTDNPALERTNIQLQSKFRSVINYRIGAEFDVPSTEFRIRGGLSVTPSPYKNDPSSFDQTLMTGGFGYFLQRNIMLDGAVAYGSYKTFRNQYSLSGTSDASRSNESVSTTLFNFTVSYRF
ncbi:MAG: outer membrane protein transport protein [Bacteroidetes bacterium]|nr:outer membrane protein transport protein [Bacteroidota bacterium]